MASIPDESIDLVVTSPPYPMIEMWDGVFAALEPEIGGAIERKEGEAAFEGSSTVAKASAETIESVESVETEE